jgi:hypothetical protein
MDRPHRESRQRNGITLRGLSQLTFATKLAQSSRSWSATNWSSKSKIGVVIGSLAPVLRVTALRREGEYVTAKQLLKLGIITMPPARREDHPPSRPN